MDNSSENLYKIRKGANGERIIHAPQSASGWYRLEAKTNGTFIYTPVV